MLVNNMSPENSSAFTFRLPIRDFVGSPVVREIPFYRVVISFEITGPAEEGNTVGLSHGFFGSNPGITFGVHLGFTVCSMLNTPLVRAKRDKTAASTRSSCFPVGKVANSSISSRWSLRKRTLFCSNRGRTRYARVTLSGLCFCFLSLKAPNLIGVS